LFKFEALNILFKSLLEKIASVVTIYNISTGLPSSVCVVGCAFVMAVLVYQISKTKPEI